MSSLSKLILLILGIAPFVVLAGNASRKISFSFISTAALSAIGGGIFYTIYGLGRHPHLESIFNVLFILWPIALIVTKVYCSWMPWKHLWISIPIMSWFTTVIAVSSNYPINGGGGGLGMLVTLCIGWLYSIPIFLIFHTLYLMIAKFYSLQKQSQNS